MSEPYIGEIRLAAFSYAPRGWALCDGATMSISTNDALFSLIGTLYGGDGVQTFNLPDLRGRAPLHFNSSFPQGQLAGDETVTLTTNQIPAHTHPLLATSAAADLTNPANALLAAAVTDVYVPPTAVVPMAATTTADPVGGGQPHENMMPFLTMNFIISLYGIFPQQS
jgi:microcystin-dependent protein